MFCSPLDYRDLGGERWTLLSDLYYYSEILKGVITVPKGTHTDLASIPRIFWRVIPKVGPWNYAAVLHDRLYERTGKVTVSKMYDSATSREVQLTRHDCDKLLLEAMGAAKPASVLGELVDSIVEDTLISNSDAYNLAVHQLRVPTRHRWAIYIGVVLGGTLAWNGHVKRHQQALVDTAGLHPV